MPFSFEQTEKTLSPCPKCGYRPLKKDRINAKGIRQVTYYCPLHLDTMTATGANEKEARKAWIRCVLNARKWG